MSRTATSLRLTESAPPLPGLPTGTLTAQQQLEALRRVQEQAEQRVQLGMRLFKAADAATGHQQELVTEIRDDQQRLRDRVEQDVARSLHTYDQWIGDVGDGFHASLKKLEGRIDELQSQWQQTQKRIEGMMNRSEAFLDSARTLPATLPAGERNRPSATISVAPDGPRAVDAPTQETEPQVWDSTAIKSSKSSDDTDEQPSDYGELLQDLLAGGQIDGRPEPSGGDDAGFATKASR